jgi:hypothetical protein
MSTPVGRPVRRGGRRLLKFYTRYGRFPRGRAEFPDEAVEFVARQIKVSGAELGLYEWTGRTVERHRARYALTWGLADGEQKSALAREFGISRETVYSYLRTAPAAV